LEYDVEITFKSVTDYYNCSPLIIRNHEITNALVNEFKKKTVMRKQEKIRNSIFRLREEEFIPTCLNISKKADFLYKYVVRADLKKLIRNQT